MKPEGLYNTVITMTPSSTTFNLWFYTLTLLCVTSTGQGIIRYSIVEENAPRQRVGDVAQSAGLMDSYSEEVLSTLRYQFSGVPTPGRDLFTVSDTGILSTSGTVDRDRICAKQEVCEVNIDITVSPGQYFRIIQVVVQINDTNDNSPVFTPDTLDLSLSEISSQGTTLSLHTATDNDSPVYGIQRYQLYGEGNTFRLQTSRRPDGEYDLSLMLVGPLDRESEDRYVMTLVAEDGAAPPNTGVLTVNVNVQDFNDNRPVFSSESYHRVVSEDMSPGDTIIRVEAEDLDAGLNGQVIYGFSSRTDAEVSGVFRIDPTTGDIILLDHLDYETTIRYVLDVTARDSDPDSSPTEARLVIEVLDENDHSPEIIVNTDDPSAHLKVTEEQPVPQFVGHITVNDRDAEQNGQFTCVLEGDGFNLEQYPDLHTEYKIMSEQRLDRETRDQYEVTLNCTDQGQEPLTSSKVIVIDIEDINDNSPQFDRDTYDVSIRENNPPAYHVITITATDDDVGSNGEIRYTIVSSTVSSHMFDINPLSGDITLRTSVDYERHDSIHLTLQASDQGIPSRSSTSMLIISVDDVDDAEPRFLQNVYTFYVSEELPPSTAVGNVTAVDPDTPPVSPSRPSFMYSLDPQNNPGGSFTINQYTGELFTSRKLDREAQDRYNLVVHAIDNNHTSAQVGSAQVTVFVSDVNDNSPILEFPSPANNTIHIHSDLSIGEVFGRILARDRDQVTTLTYRIISGNSHGYFIVSKHSGELSSAVDLRNTEEQMFSLVVGVLDGNHQSASNLNIVLSASADERKSQGVLADRNLVIVIVIACVTAVIVVLLLIAIVAVVRRRRDYSKYNYKARLVDQAKARETQIQPLDVQNSSVEAGHSRRGAPEEERDGGLYTQHKQMSHCLYNPDGGSHYPLSTYATSGDVTGHVTARNNSGQHGGGGGGGGGGHGRDDRDDRDDDTDSALSNDMSDSGRGSNEDVESPNGKGVCRAASDRVSSPTSDLVLPRSSTTAPPYGSHPNLPPQHHPHPQIYPRQTSTRRHPPPEPPTHQSRGAGGAGLEGDMYGVPPRRTHSGVVPYRQPPPPPTHPTHPTVPPAPASTHSAAAAPGYVSTSDLDPGVHITGHHRDSQRSRPYDPNQGLHWLRQDYTASNA